MKTVEFKVYIQPGAKNSERVGVHGDAVKIRLKSRPIEGKANSELVDFLADFLSVKKSSIEIIRGKQSRLKTIKMGYDESCKAIEEKLSVFFKK